jgi:hypothetical protein
LAPFQPLPRILARFDFAFFSMYSMIMLAMSRTVTFSTPAETYFGRDTAIKVLRSRTNRSRT